MHLDLLFGSSGESHIYIFILSATCPVPHDGAFAQEENDLCHPPVRPITQTAHLQSRLDRVERYWMKQVKAHIPREKKQGMLRLGYWAPRLCWKRHEKAWLSGCKPVTIQRPGGCVGICPVVLNVNYNNPVWNKPLVSHTIRLLHFGGRAGWCECSCPVPTNH